MTAKSVSLLRFLQAILVLVQLSALILFGDLCTGFKEVQVCQLKEAKGIERYCLPFGITDLRSLYETEGSWNSMQYVLLYTGIWVLLALIELIFAAVCCFEKHGKNGSFSSSLIACLLELVVLCTQIGGAVYVYNSWQTLWQNEYYQPKFPINFHVAFFIASICLLMVIFEEFVASPRIYFVRRREAQPSNDNEDELTDAGTPVHATATIRTYPSTNQTNRTQASFSSAY